jgi:hypothetical protein
MAIHFRRREFIATLGSAAVAWPIAARAQQPTMPIVCMVATRSPEEYARLGGAFRKGLNETDYIEGQNVTVEYHWLQGQYNRLPSLMADLVGRRVAVIAALASGCACSQSCDHDNPDYLHRQRKPRQFGAGCQPCSAGRQYDRHQYLFPRTCRQAAGALARLATQCRSSCRAGQSGQYGER